MDIVKKRESRIDPIYKHPMKPGYEGFIPKLREKFGHRYSVAVTEAISQFEKNYLKNRCNERKLRVRGALQMTDRPKSLGERSVIFLCVY